MKFSFEAFYRTGVFALLILNLWMKTQYVSVETYKADHKETLDSIKTLSDAIIEMRAQKDANQRFQKAIDDHELRLRIVERITR